MNVLRDRCSTRDFLDKEVSDDIIKEIIYSAICAPSAGNQQPWEFYVIKNKKILNELALVSPYASCLKNANQAFVLVNYKNVKHPNYVLCDMSACTENLLLEIENQGLGGVWLGISPDRKRIDYVNNVLKLGDDVDSFAIIPFGYKKNEITKNRVLDEKIIHYIR